MTKPVTIIGAGLAGSEAAWQLARRGLPSRLYEMRPLRQTPAHHGGDCAELVCSNSLRADRLENGVGLLKEEMRRMDSLILRCADAHRVPAGGALAVDREGYARAVTEALMAEPLVELRREECREIPEEGYVIIATGPLTDGVMAESVARLTGEPLSFFDAAAPIVSLDSLDLNILYRASRYDKGVPEGGEGDYLNAPMDRARYEAFWAALTTAERAPLEGFEDSRVFEGCMPVEVMARRGRETLCHGPLKPMGLRDPRTGKKPYAVVQLRQDNRAGTLYNLVGFQTNLRQGEQRRVFRMIPGLERAEFLRYGVMHRNTYLRAPGCLRWDYRLRGEERIAFAGQMTGVEGYVESAASGLWAAVSIALEQEGRPCPDLGRQTAMGALGHYVAEGSLSSFQPSNIHFGLIDPLEERIRDKRARNLRIAERALERLEALRPEWEPLPR